MMEQDPFPEKSRETSPGTLAGTRRKQKIMMEQSLFLGRIENPIQLQSCLGKNHTGTDSFLRKTRRETRRETNPGTRAGTSKNQEIMMEQPSFLSKERRAKKGAKPRNQSRNQQETGNHDGQNRLLF